MTFWHFTFRDRRGAGARRRRRSLAGCIHPAVADWRSVQRFAAENASHTGNPEHDPIPSERIML